MKCIFFIINSIVVVINVVNAPEVVLKYFCECCLCQSSTVEIIGQI